MLFPLYDENPVKRTPVVTYLLVAANVLVFLWTWQLPPEKNQVLVYQRGFMPARLAQLKTGQTLNVEVSGKAVSTWFGVVQGRQIMPLPPDPGQITLSLMTCMFLHGSFLHLLGNMWFLYLFGNNVEDRLGPGRFLFLYLLGGVLASFSHWLVDPGSRAPVIGASGAVAAILGAYTVTWPWARVHTLVFLFIFVTLIEVPALVVNGLWFLGQIFAGEQVRGGSGGVAWWAHVGGFLTGAALMLALDSFRHADKQPTPIKEHIEENDDH